MEIIALTNEDKAQRFHNQAELERCYAEINFTNSLQRPTTSLQYRECVQHCFYHLFLWANCTYLANELINPEANSFVENTP